MSEGESDDSRARVVPLRSGAGSSTNSGTRSPGASARSPNNPPAPTVVSFNRQELQTILNVYGRQVAAGEWRDYAIDFTPDRAVFSIFRRTSEVPLFRVEKDPKLARRQGAYCVVASGGVILKRGHDLERVVEVLERKTKLVVV